MRQPHPFVALIAASLLLSCSRPAPSGGSQVAAGTPADSTAPATPDTASSPKPDSVPAAKPDSTPAPKPVSSSPAKPVTKPVTQPATPPSTTVATASPSGDAPLRDPYHSAPLDTVDARVYQGWKYFNLNCARCHGEDVSGTTIAPHLIMSLKPNGPIPDFPTFLTTVCGGRLEKGMPAWCKLGMSPGEIDTIYAYVKGRSDAKLHPGRPARREG